MSLALNLHFNIEQSVFQQILTMSTKTRLVKEIGEYVYFNI